MSENMMGRIILKFLIVDISLSYFGSFCSIKRIEPLLSEHTLLSQPGMPLAGSAKIGFYEPTKMGSCRLYLVT